jgi:hypothetical protein
LLLKRERRTRSRTREASKEWRRRCLFIFFSSTNRRVFNEDDEDDRPLSPSGVLSHSKMSPIHHHHDGNHSIPNAYEQEREARIAANRARLVELGIVATTNASASSAGMMPLGVLNSDPSEWAKSVFGGNKAKRRPTVALNVSPWCLYGERERKRKEKKRKEKGQRREETVS